MTTNHRVTLELPVRGSSPDYAGAIALALCDANLRGDLGGASALAGLMSAIKLPPSHNPDVELGPWLADIEPL
jgi:hypothetical protein